MHRAPWMRSLPGGVDQLVDGEVVDPLAQPGPTVGNSDGRSQEPTRKVGHGSHPLVSVRLEMIALTRTTILKTLVDTLLDGVNHVAILTNDTERLVRFYQEAFEATVRAEMAAGEGSRLTFIDISPSADLNVLGQLRAPGVNVPERIVMARRTSSGAAKAASKALRDGRTGKASKTAAGSALSQAAPKKKGK